VDTIIGVRQLDNNILKNLENRVRERVKKIKLDVLNVLDKQKGDKNLTNYIFFLSI
jgi:hypothetical protein